jgi:LDH2 family malate/lactate/ureidoglycolate dehydrogenase
MSARSTVSPDWLVEAVGSVLAAAGLRPRAATAVARGLVEADLRGTPSDGVTLVPMYAERIRKGSVGTHESAEVVHDMGAIAVLDAGHALGQLTGDQAMDLAVLKARTYGIGVVTVRHAFHFGGAYRYARTAAYAGCIGIAAANSGPLLPAAGGAAAVVGENPLAVAVPTENGEPIILSAALSEEALAGLLLPATGHLGYGLALVVDILTGVLSGGGFGSGVRDLNADTSEPIDCAHFFLALSVSAFGNRAGFEQRVTELAAQTTGSPKASGTERLLLPGQLEAERKTAARRVGVPLDRKVLAALRETATTVGITLSAPS